MDGEVDGCSGGGAGTGGGGVDDGGSDVPVDGVERGGVDAGGCVDSGGCRSRKARRSSAKRWLYTKVTDRGGQLLGNFLAHLLQQSTGVWRGTSLELDGGGSVDGMVGDGCVVDD